MAWTDQCKIEAVGAVDHKINQGMDVRDALKAVEAESDIPAGTLKRWKYSEKAVPKNGNKPHKKPGSTLAQIYRKLKNLDQFLRKNGVIQGSGHKTNTHLGADVNDGPPERCNDEQSKTAWKASLLTHDMFLQLMPYFEQHIPKKEGS